MGNMKQYDQSNVFAKIINGELECKKVYENDSVLAFHDHKPSAPVHILLIPKMPVVDFDDFMSQAGDKQVAEFFRIAHSIGEEFTDGHYKVLTNNGKKADQVVFHFHLHIRGGEKSL